MNKPIIISYKRIEYPSSIYDIPVVFKRTDSITLMWYANIKWYAPKALKDEIWIFENSFSLWQDYLMKILEHEANHFLYHKYYTEEQKQFLEWIFNISKDEVFPSWYSKTSVFEFASEIVGYYEAYIKKGIELPKGKQWTEWTQFIYDILEKFNILAISKMK
jgi:hypothetical protein